MQARDHAMEGTFHTVLVSPFEDSIQDVMDKDNYWNRGSTAKYVPVTEGMKNAVEARPVGRALNGVGKQSMASANKLALPFSHDLARRNTHGLHTKDLSQPSHLPVFE